MGGLRSAASGECVASVRELEVTMRDEKTRRALRGVVWAARAAGWILIALAILNALPLGVFGPAGSLRFVSSFVLGLLGLAWVVGLELFLRFFDRYLSRN